MAFIPLTRYSLSPTSHTGSVIVERRERTHPSRVGRSQRHTKNSPASVGLCHRICRTIAAEVCLRRHQLVRYPQCSAPLNADRVRLQTTSAHSKPTDYHRPQIHEVVDEAPRSKCHVGDHVMGTKCAANVSSRAHGPWRGRWLIEANEPASSAEEAAVGELSKSEKECRRPMLMNAQPQQSSFLENGLHAALAFHWSGQGLVGTYATQQFGSVTGLNRDGAAVTFDRVAGSPYALVGDRATAFSSLGSPGKRQFGSTRSGRLAEYPWGPKLVHGCLVNNRVSDRVESLLTGQTGIPSSDTLSETCLLPGGRSEPRR